MSWFMEVYDLTFDGNRVLLYHALDSFKISKFEVSTAKF